MTTFWKMAGRRETLWPMLGLSLATAASVGLVTARVIHTGNLRYTFLLWNLFLAWLPLILALGACGAYHRAGQAAPWRRNWTFLGLGGAWLLFFPNAPYILTDVIHLTARFSRHFWVDLVLILLCAFTGLVLGFVSLYLMQSVVARVFGRVVSWLFIGVVAALSGFGVYLGRFLRFNSWDVIVKPKALWQGIGNWAADPFAHSTSYAFPLLFAIFLFVAYVMLYALTHLQQLQPAPVTPDAQAARHPAL
ncbi:MAG TPA: DUF1361 domain-containing protein [Verrucomicrobiota bacterium]|nr:DUF1361 domain-containing protein [Verrucomicrobiota bacterium]HRT09661.1 DUF1361 domain-containing protein [Candidatus Paceibacterota bacterium]